MGWLEFLVIPALAAAGIACDTYSNLTVLSAVTAVCSAWMLGASVYGKERFEFDRYLSFVMFVLCQFLGISTLSSCVRRVPTKIRALGSVTLFSYLFDTLVHSIVTDPNILSTLFGLGFALNAIALFLVFRATRREEKSNRD